MAALPIGDGRSTPSNVARLPSACSREVDNLRCKEQRAAAMAARLGTAHRFRSRGRADRERQEGTDKNAERQPALLLVMALIAAQDDATRSRIVDTTAVALSRDPECLASWQAHEIAMKLRGPR